MRRSARLSAIGVALGMLTVPVLVGVAGPEAASTAADTPTEGLEYVALGDSFTAGFGVGPYSDQPAPGCYQSTQNYPHLVAEKLGLELTDASCSGAVTANIIDTPQRTITGEGTAPVQAEALSADTDIVTVTIGGNDLGFSDIAMNCAAASASGPTYSGYWTCKAYYDLPDNSLTQKLDTVVAPALATTYALITQKAPNAKVFVVGYPAIAPDAANTPTDGCFRSLWYSNSFPFTATDTAMIHSVEAQFAKAIEDRAEVAAVNFVPTFAQSLAHSACAPPDEAYIAGVTVSSSASAEQIEARGLQYSDIEVGALHPNALGIGYLETEVADAVVSAVTAAGLGATGAVGGGPPQLGADPGDHAWVVWLVGGVLVLLLLIAATVFVVARRRDVHPPR